MICYTRIVFRSLAPFSMSQSRRSALNLCPSSIRAANLGELDLGGSSEGRRLVSSIRAAGPLTEMGLRAALRDRSLSSSKRAEFPSRARRVERKERV